MINNLRVGHCSLSSSSRRITGGKITTFNLSHLFFDGGIHWWISPIVSFRMAWISFGALPCLKKKNFIRDRVPILKKSRAPPDMLPFCICNKKKLAIRHTNKPLFPTTLSIPSYDIGKYVIQRTYQHPNVRLKYGLSQSKNLRHPYRKKKKIFF